MGIISDDCPFLQEDGRKYAGGLEISEENTYFG
jgi:hypothetical protein